MRDEIQRLLDEIKSACGTPDLTDEEIKEIWHEVLRRVVDRVGYKPFRVEIPQGKILTDLYKHEKWEIPYTDEWVKCKMINYLKNYGEYFDENGNKVHCIKR